MSLTGAIENLTDEDYRIHGSGLNEAGRNFILASGWRFQAGFEPLKVGAHSRWRA